MWSDFNVRNADMSSIKQSGSSNRASTCSARDVVSEINIDTDRLANAAEEIRKAIVKVPPEITIKFCR